MLLVGRWATILGVVISIGAAYLVMNAAGIMDYVQALFSFFISPLLGVVLMGMFWKRATKAGGFWGLLIGTLTSIGLWAWVKFDPPALRYVALSPDAKDMAENMYRALWSVSVCGRRQRRRQPVQQAAAAGRAGRAGLRRNQAAQRRAGAVLQERVVLDGDRDRRLPGAQHLLLVRRTRMHSSGISIWFFIGVLAYRLWRDDSRLWHV